jgi:hypothetical protein
MLNELAPPSKSGGLWGIVSCPFVFQRVSASMELYPSLLILKYFISIYYYHIYIYMNFTAPGLCNKSVKRACIYIYIYIYINRRSNKGKNNIIITTTTIIINWTSKWRRDDDLLLFLSLSLAFQNPQAWFRVRPPTADATYKKTKKKDMVFDSTPSLFNNTRR